MQGDRQADVASADGEGADQEERYTGEGEDAPPHEVLPEAEEPVLVHEPGHEREDHCRENPAHPEGLRGGLVMVLCAELLVGWVAGIARGHSWSGVGHPAQLGAPVIVRRC